MSEFIPSTPEAMTSVERYSWDNILRALAVLSDLNDEIDAYETIEDLRNETEEDAITLIYNYAVITEVPEGQSSELEETENLLRRYRLIDSNEGDDE